MTNDHQSDREARVVQLLQTAAQTERAPASLRAEVERRAQAKARRRSLAPALPRLGLRYASMATTAVAAVVVALVIAMSGGGGLSIAQAAQLATRGPSAAAPVPFPAAPHTLLTTRVGSLHFPNWESAQGWRATGARTDEIGGRSVTTVYYSKGGQKVAYSIISAPALNINAHGEPYVHMSQDGRTVVVWQEHNHTCVLSASGISPRQLWRLAISPLS